MLHRDRLALATRSVTRYATPAWWSSEVSEGVNELSGRQVTLVHSTSWPSHIRRPLNHRTLRASCHRARLPAWRLRAARLRGKAGDSAEVGRGGGGGGGVHVRAHTNKGWRTIKIDSLGNRLLARRSVLLCVFGGGAVAPSTTATLRGLLHHCMSLTCPEATQVKLRVKLLSSACDLMSEPTLFSHDLLFECKDAWAARTSQHVHAHPELKFYPHWFSSRGIKFITDTVPVFLKCLNSRVAAIMTL